MPNAAETANESDRSKPRKGINQDLPRRLGFLASARRGGVLLFGKRVGNANIAMLTNISIAEIKTRPETPCGKQVSDNSRKINNIVSRYNCRL